MWVVAYVETLDASPWRTFCLRELGRVTGDYAALRMDEARRQERERLDEVADALSSLDK